MVRHHYVRKQCLTFFKESSFVAAGPTGYGVSIFTIHCTEMIVVLLNAIFSTVLCVTYAYTVGLLCVLILCVVDVTEYLCPRAHTFMCIHVQDISFYKTHCVGYRLIRSVTATELCLPHHFSYEQFIFSSLYHSNCD